MTKNEGLEMAIEALEGLCETFMLGDDWIGVGAYDYTVDAINNCKEALALPDWQGLTDDEIATIDQSVDEQLLEDNFSVNDYIHEFAGAIEQALKEKNYAGND